MVATLKAHLIRAKYRLCARSVDATRLLGQRHVAGRLCKIGRVLHAFMGPLRRAQNSRLLRIAPSRGVQFVAEVGYLADVEEPPEQLARFCEQLFNPLLHTRILGDIGWVLLR